MHELAGIKSSICGNLGRRHILSRMCVFWDTFSSLHVDFDFNQYELHAHLRHHEQLMFTRVHSCVVNGR